MGVFKISWKHSSADMIFVFQLSSADINLVSQPNSQLIWVYVIVRRAFSMFSFSSTLKADIDFTSQLFYGRQQLDSPIFSSGIQHLRPGGACKLTINETRRHHFHLSTFYGFITGRFNAVTGRHALQIWIFFNHEVLAWPLHKDDTHTQIERCKQFFELL